MIIIIINKHYQLTAKRRLCKSSFYLIMTELNKCIILLQRGREREEREGERGTERQTGRPRERERDRQTERKSLVTSVNWNSSQTATVHHMQFLYKGTQHHQHTHTHMYVFMNINKHIHILPSSLADNILSYSSLRVSSLSFSILWQIMVTCFIVNNG